MLDYNHNSPTHITMHQSKDVVFDNMIKINTFALLRGINPCEETKYIVVLGDI